MVDSIFGMNITYGDKETHKHPLIESCETTSKMSVVHPSHYGKKQIQPIQLMAADLPPEQFIGFLRGNILKYVLRYDEKNGVDDLKKAQTYLGWLITYMESGRINV